MNNGISMKCPYCAHPETKVLDSRETEDQATTRRRRECLQCAKRFTTFERVEMTDLTIIKKDGRREKYDRDKIRSGIVKACQKRPVPQERIEEAVNEIERELKGMDTTEIESTKVGELVMRKLKALDKVAYIRFASIYKEFQDIETFELELKKLIRK
jgi:transcriptional repressor NrdR